MSKKDKKYKPKKTWFFIRKADDKLVFEESKSQAWERHKDPAFKNFGTSDGTTYKKMMDKNKKEIKKLSNKARKVRERIEKMRDNREKMITEEFHDEDDPKVEKADRRIEEEEEKLAQIQEKMKDKQRNKVKKAQKAEAKQAEENGYTPPPNQDVKTPYESGKKRALVVNELSEHGTSGQEVTKEQLKQLLKQME